MNVKSKKWKKLNRTQVALVERWIFCIELTLYLWSRLSQVQFAVAFFSECGRFSEAQKIRSSCRVRRKYIFVDTGGGFFSSLHAQIKALLSSNVSMEKCCIILKLGSVRVKDVDSTTDKIRTPKCIVDVVTVGGTGTCITRCIFPFSLEPRVLRLFRPLDRNCTRGDIVRTCRTFHVTCSSSSTWTTILIFAWQW